MMIERLLDELEVEGTMPVEAGERVEQKDVEESPNLLSRRSSGRDREEGLYVEVEHKKDVVEVFLEGRGGRQSAA